MKKNLSCLCENKDADQLCSNCTADQHLCFRYSDRTNPPLLISKISSFQPSSVTAQIGLCLTWWARNPEDPFSCDVAQMNHVKDKSTTCIYAS